MVSFFFINFPHVKYIVYYNNNNNNNNEFIPTFLHSSSAFGIYISKLVSNTYKSVKSTGKLSTGKVNK
jgi:hypothetical protein